MKTTKNNELEITLTIDGRSFRCRFVRSEDAGYRPGGWCVDMPNGDLLSIRAGRGAWTQTRIRNGVGIRTTRHSTLTAACNDAAEKLAGETLDAEAFVP